MTDHWSDRLSEYLDGDLAAEDRTALEAHLERCAECRETLASLRRVVTRARAMADRPPTRDLWPGIAARIGARAARPAARRGFTFSLPQLAAAGIALAVASGGTAWLLHPGTAVPPIPPAVPGPPAITAAAGEARGAGSYDVAVADLEQILEEGRGRLDTATVRVLEQNLAAIDAALTQARRAVEADSANLYLNSHLAATMRRKLELLRQAATLVATAS
ncbi:MAG TPA: zf-HC2 domain-containing protein [Gemmatimonadales bacterium]